MPGELHEENQRGVASRMCMMLFQIFIVGAVVTHDVLESSLGKSLAQLSAAAAAAHPKMTGAELAALHRQQRRSEAERFYDALRQHARRCLPYRELSRAGPEDGRLPLFARAEAATARNYLWRIRSIVVKTLEVINAALLEVDPGAEPLSAEFVDEICTGSPPVLGGGRR